MDIVRRLVKYDLDDETHCSAVYVFVSVPLRAPGSFLGLSGRKAAMREVLNTVIQETTKSRPWIRPSLRVLLVSGDGQYRENLEWWGTEILKVLSSHGLNTSEISVSLSPSKGEEGIDHIVWGRGGHRLDFVIKWIEAASYYGKLERDRQRAEYAQQIDKKREREEEQRAVAKSAAPRAALTRGQNWLQLFLSENDGSPGVAELRKAHGFDRDGERQASWKIYERLAYSESEPVAPLAKVGLGVWYQKGNSYSNAKPILESAISSNHPDASALAMVCLADMHWKYGERADARGWFAKAAATEHPIIAPIAKANVDEHES